MKYFQYHLPTDIERESMATITRELAQMGVVIQEENEAVVKRVIHTTADFEYAKNLVFTPQAVSKALSAVKDRPVIITDTNMALAGINKTALAQVGGRFTALWPMPMWRIWLEQTGRRGRRRPIDQGGCPLSPCHLCLWQCAHRPDPSGSGHGGEERVPGGYHRGAVGFVNVVESKEDILALAQEKQFPPRSRGRKAWQQRGPAAICNALLYQAVGREL